VNGAGSAIEWLRSRVAMDVDRALPSLRHEPPANVPLFMNGVGGLGAPFWAADFPVEFVGTGDDLQLLAAVVESIAFLLSINLDAMRTVAALDRIRISGGLARSDYLCATLADVSGLVVERYALREATARGAAYLAAGEPVDWIDLPVEQRFEPASSEALKTRRARWHEEMSRRLRRS
jgi:glycerol kinase